MKIVNRNTAWFPSILEDFFTENRLDVPNYENFSIPSVNIQENLTSFVIELAAPGLKKENFAIEVEDSVLRISTEVSTEAEKESLDNSSKFTLKEFNYGNFKRAFNLPDTVTVEEISAKYEDGILRIALPKKKEEKALKKMVEIS